MLEDSNLQYMIQNIDEIPPATPFLRKVSGAEDGEEYVISYFLYEYKGEDNQPIGAIVVDVDIGWVMQNLRQDDLEPGKESILYLIDSKGNMIAGQDSSPATMQVVKGSYTAQIESSSVHPGDSRFYVHKVEGTSMLITYLSLPHTDWVLIKTQDYSEVYRSTRKLQFLFATLLFLAVTSFLAMWITRKIYSPIGELMSDIGCRKNSDADKKHLDEIGFIHRTLLDFRQEAEQFRNRFEAQTAITRNYHLRSLLTDSYSFDADALRKARSPGDIDWTAGGSYAVCIIAIDGIDVLREHYTPADCTLLQYGFMNIFEEVLRRRFHCCLTADQDYRNTAIVEVHGTEWEITLRQLLEDAQVEICRYFPLTVSVAAGEAVEGYRRLSEAYHQAQRLLWYRFVLGTNTVIQIQDISPNLESARTGCSDSAMKKMEESLLLGDSAGALAAQHRLLSEARELEYHYMMAALLQIVIHITDVIDRMNLSRTVPIPVDFVELAARLFQFETLDAFAAELTRKLNEVFDENRRREEQRKFDTVQTMKELIREGAFRSDFSAQEMADSLLLSPKYLGKLYRVIEGIGIGDAIQAYRMQQAAELLRTTTRNVGEIARQVGIENESYFYTLFKKHYGVTPKEFQGKRGLEK